ncbi:MULTISPECIES: DUF5511 family protein [Bacillus cereus group]|uniref:DUF5511 family protein n=1 Tax=Bacillus cereus group TaxID=86661 RepID=UPI000278EACA|nr:MULTISPECIES: DUF5511 family protein [Bacillus cereus group]EJQ19565.1 hypothetical protein IE9_05734 [Bacillus cereus BAG4X12-1]EOO43586.1 hypothetical protein ICK_06884 [Bacillus cereus BAG1X2-2]EOP77794.1 hypothetical protein IEG_05582 [Bacillus cereus BAG5X12-1]MEC2259423.1 DUF5511 family protein [Bacillus cereus]PEB72629.1 hypothetical protein COM89_27000 [Bacillus thuringiensis]
MSQNNFYMIEHVDQVKNEVHLSKYLFNKQVIVKVSKEEAAAYADFMDGAAEHDSLPFVKYDEGRGVICE